MGRRIDPVSRKRKLVTLGAGAALGLLLLLLVFVGSAVATDQPAFCASCHEMKPYAQAHTVGPHAKVACVDCHVGTNPVVRLTHKFAALGEVRDHFFGRPLFPLETGAVEPVTNARCVHCHATVNVKLTGFSHARHALGRQCVSCHGDAGHAITTTALAQAGILSSRRPNVLASLNSQALSSQETTLPGHVTVVCSQCHNMALTPCSKCHKPAHKPRGECSTCHHPGAAFVFSHPLAATDCSLSGCHTPPASNHNHPQPCATCHLHPGANWSFTHPSETATCTTCHTPPAKNHNHPQACVTCHTKLGVTWAFSHPTSSARCLTCHTAPANHRTSGCPRCHRTGVSWKFIHPSRSARCAGCHQAPASHYGSTCSTCHHQAGVSWAFSHPGSSARCASCHKPPASHYGTNCASCHHKPGVSWSFAHPATSMPGWRNIACNKCHPSGPPKVYCTCHNGNSPGGN